MPLACGGSSGDSGAPSATDAGPDTTSGPPPSDGGASDSANDAPQDAGPPPAVTVVVNAGTPGAPIVATELGANLVVSSGAPATPALLQALVTQGVRVIRWPGGTESDLYHWQTNTICADPAANSRDAAPANDFDDFMARMHAENLDVVMTANYGTNAACNAGGDPTEAAAWVAHAKALAAANGYTSIRYWTVGNEVYRSNASGSEPDYHGLDGAAGLPNDPGTYAAAVGDGGADAGYYALMKGADNQVQVGVVVNPGQEPWDHTVLHNAAYDYVEIHEYPEYNHGAGADNDAFLLGTPTGELASHVATLKAELADAGHPDTPIMLGEVNAEGILQTHQSVSIVNALFCGLVFGEYLNDGLAVITWYTGTGSSYNADPAFVADAGLYGWQSWGTFDLVADNAIQDNLFIDAGTPLPPAIALGLVAQFAQPGNHMLVATVAGDAGASGDGGASSPTVRAYGATQGTGYALMLFNLDENAAVTVAVTLSGATGTSFTQSTQTYSKAVYDLSRDGGVWAGPVDAATATVGSSFDVTLPPWSQTVIVLR
jgi:hypothetical protein